MDERAMIYLFKTKSGKPFHWSIFDGDKIHFASHVEIEVPGRTHDKGEVFKGKGVMATHTLEFDADMVWEGCNVCRLVKRDSGK
jgi:hypothetical protein